MLFHLIGLGLGGHLSCTHIVFWHEVLSILETFTLLHHDRELSIAVVDELDKSVVGALASRAVVQEDLEEVYCADFVVNLNDECKNGLFEIMKFGFGKIRENSGTLVLTVM